MGERRDRCECSECGRAFTVRYDEDPRGEPRELTPVNCPHCDGINYASIGRRAAEVLDFRALAERHDRYDCLGCGRPFAVVYDAEPGEAAQMAAVGCPHCAWVNYASVARSALGTLDSWYRVEKATEV